jgi:hypothetical protein
MKMEIFTKMLVSQLMYIHIIEWFEDTRTILLLTGKYRSHIVIIGWLDSFFNKYFYYDLFIYREEFIVIILIRLTLYITLPSIVSPPQPPPCPI